MNRLMIALFALVSTYTNASAMQITTCADQKVSLNDVYSMRSFAHSRIKIFEVDTIEPAAAPVGIAVAINRGEDLSTLETFCYYLSGFTSANIKQARSQYDKASQVLTLSISVTQSNEHGQNKAKTLVVSIHSAAASTNEMVKAKLHP